MERIEFLEFFRSFEFFRECGGYNSSIALSIALFVALSIALSIASYLA
jgi:hypothetical protein